MHHANNHTFEDWHIFLFSSCSAAKSVVDVADQTSWVYQQSSKFHANTFSSDPGKKDEIAIGESRQWLGRKHAFILATEHHPSRRNNHCDPTYLQTFEPTRCLLRSWAILVWVPSLDPVTCRERVWGWMCLSGLAQRLINGGELLLMGARLMIRRSLSWPYSFFEYCFNYDRLHV